MGLSGYQIDQNRPQIGPVEIHQGPVETEINHFGAQFSHFRAQIGQAQTIQVRALTA